MSLGATKNASTATAKNSSTPSAPYGSSTVSRSSSTQAQNFSYSSPSTVAQCLRASAPGNGGTPSASPSAMSSTCANSWITTLYAQSADSPASRTSFHDSISGPPPIASPLSTS